VVLAVAAEVEPLPSAEEPAVAVPRADVALAPAIPPLVPLDVAVEPPPPVAVSRGEAEPVPPFVPVAVAFETPPLLDVAFAKALPLVEAALESAAEPKPVAFEVASE
jgi:hypothetical protein